jgi:hypothetical protein
MFIVSVLLRRSKISSSQQKSRRNENDRKINPEQKLEIERHKYDEHHPTRDKT